MSQPVPCCLTIIWITALLWTSALLAQEPTADLLLIHGHILTMDSKDSVVEAIAIRDGIIVKIGSDADIQAFVGSRSRPRIIDLKGLTITPGLIDTHAHIAEGGVAELYDVKLSDATSIAEIVARVKAKVALMKGGEWITGSGWDEGKLAEHRYVTAADIDAVSRTTRFGLFIPRAITEWRTRSLSKWLTSLARLPIQRPEQLIGMVTVIPLACSRKMLR